jgi:preprotein translocase subunit SecB
MFPFIRSQVTLLTTQPGMTPIVLPPINTAKYE